MSKIKSFTEGHVSETEQKATIIMKERYTSQRSFFYSFVSKKSTCNLEPELWLKSCTEKVSFSFRGNKERKSKIKV